MHSARLTQEQERQIAAALETTPDLLPFLSELLADIWALGSWPAVIAEMLGARDLPRSTRVLDLGCGKGAVGIQLARDLGFRVLGADLFEPFIREARERAQREGVDDLCEFRVAEARDVLMSGGDFDVVIWAALGGALGSFDRCVGQLRRVVRPNGYLVIDDGFLVSEHAIARSSYDHYTSREETHRLLTRHGDELSQETLIPSSEVEACNRENNRCIQARAKGLTERFPEHADRLAGYANSQVAECEILESSIAAAVWLLQRTG
jgi:ubiquinone/menaquinone biosynthesis C-methylase UbiE